MQLSPLVPFAFIPIGVIAWLVWRNIRALQDVRADLKTAQEENRRRRQELRLLTDSLQELIFRTDPEGNIRFANARWEDITGQTPDLARGQFLRDVVLPQYQKMVTDLFAPRTNQEVRKARASLRHADGHLRSLDLTVIRLLSQDGTISGYAGSAVDVTELLTVQNQLEEQLAYKEILLEGNPLPVSLTDVEGRFISVNQAWEAFMGMSRDKVLGRHHTVFLSAPEAQTYNAYHDQLLREGGTTRYEERMCRPDGSFRDVQITKAQVRSRDGQPIGILAINLDVTDFRMACDMAEDASRTKSEFVANISHELRTPLQSILGFSELGMTRGRDHPKFAAMFSDIHDAAQTMLKLVNDLLDIAKLESNVGTFRFDRIDVREIIDDVSSEMTGLFQNRQLKLNTQLTTFPLFAKIDPSRFKQVIRNLLANAMKFSPPGSSVMVSAGIQDERSIHIQVQDSGPGIPPKELEAIFEPFVQSSETRDQSEGTGLGLAICRKILSSHGGRIYASNGKDGGAVFHVLLPTAGYSDTLPMTLT